jgi:Uncharacterized protein conserved in bacteria (DUF2188)
MGEHANRYQVVQRGYWWQVKIGDGTQTVGKFYTRISAQEFAEELLRAFRDGQFLGDAEIARLRQLHAEACEIAAQHRAERDAADRRKRINDLAARYAGELMESIWCADLKDMEMEMREAARFARALAAAVVEAEE